MSGYRIGIDVGGTFTDFTMLDEAGRLAVHKTPSTPQDPSEGVFDGLRALAAAGSLSFHDFIARIATIVHGTTVCTNALLTRSGARVGLVTTAGFRDVLQMRRGLRESRYDNTEKAPESLVPRELRSGVRERTGADGSILTPLATDDLAAVAESFRRHEVQAIAICFMHAYLRNEHEVLAASYLRQALPGAFVSVSSDLVSRIGLYERTSATVINSYVGPALSRYLTRLQRRLAEAGCGARLLIIQSNGGVAAPEICIRRPATTVLSGPASGPVLGIDVLAKHGCSDGVVVDMGGTSFDVALIQDGQALFTDEGAIDKLHLGLPMLQIHTIGAGGGSIGWIDGGGLLHVGPRSAGADPGPACYGKGGGEPTVTDANLVLGYLDPGFVLGGSMRLDGGSARHAIATRVAEPLQLTVDAAAAGIFRVINTNLAAAIREVSVERGIDPRRLSLVVGGGAGPIHAGFIAQELGMPMVIVPRHSSVLCAAGALFTDFIHDLVRTHLGVLVTLDWPTMEGLAREMHTEAERTLDAEGIAAGAREFRWSFDLMYEGQHHHIGVPVAAQEFARRQTREILARFHQTHDRLYGYSLPEKDAGVSMVNLRLTAIGHVPRPALPAVPRTVAAPEAACKGSRPIWLPDANSTKEVPIYDGERLTHGHELPGPAVVETGTTTIVVPGGCILACDASGNFLLTPASHPVC
ncbi:MAG: hydantoinase/oxoprolinase family protein [Burkholderiales bacterium]|nr:hydantoinase/oxoprolinase family protein [Burkholderiales bacterium]